MPIRIDDEIGVWGITAKDVQRQLDEATGDVDIVIDSPGGDVFEGVQIHNAIKAYDKGRVTVRVNSMAASIASYIAMAGDTVSAMNNSTWMIHNVWTFAVGDHNELRKSADVAEGLTHLLASAYAAKTGRPKSEVLAMMDEETWLFGDEIKQGGFADEVEDVDFDEERQTLAAVATERFKACRKHVKEHAEEADVDRMAALLATREPEEPETVISRDVLAKRFKLITGESL